MKFIISLFFVSFVSTAYAVETIPCAQMVTFGSNVDSAAIASAAASDGDPDYAKSVSLFGLPLMSYQEEDIDLLKQQASACREEASHKYKDLRPDLYEEAVTPLTTAAYALSRLKTLYHNEKDQQNREEKQAATKAQYESHKEAVMSGAIKISSIGDVVIFKNIKNSLLDIMASPLLNPDNSLYAGGIVIDANDSGYIRGKYQSGFADEPMLYVFLKTTKKTVYFNPSIMRIGASIGLVGKYIGNMDYTTVLGTQKTAPIIECDYIGEYQDDLDSQISANQKMQSNASTKAVPTQSMQPKKFVAQPNPRIINPTEKSVLNKYKVSFDCHKAASNVEKLICGTPVLGQLDGLLSETYQERMEMPVFGVDKKKFKADSRMWLKNTRNLCSDADCLEKSYRARIEDLCGMPVISGAHPMSDCDVI